MLSTNHCRIIFLFAVLMASVAINEAQRRWGQGGWGQMDPIDSSITFDDDSPVGPDSSVGWGSDQFGWNNVDNNRPSGPGQNFPGNRPNRLTSTTTTGRTTARTTNAAGRTTASSGATSTSTQTPARLNPEETQCTNRCPASTEYNPVCGSNRMTYNNPGRLRCAASCGTNVQLLHFGVCREVGEPQVFPRRDP